jgi:tryptophan synthase alpha chain
MGRVNATFKRLRWEKEAALIPSVTMGQPSFDVTRQIVPLMARQGADLIVLGQAVGATLEDCFQVVTDVRRANEVPLIFRWYPTWLGDFNVEEFVQMCADAGFDGLWGDWQAANARQVREACEEAGISIVASVTPEMSISEIHTELEGANGFVICRLNPPFEASAGSESEQKEANFITGLRDLTQIPIVLSIPFDTPQNVSAAAGIADGVLVGPDLHSLVKDLHEDEIIPVVGDYIRELKAAAMKVAGSE